MDNIPLLYPKMPEGADEMVLQPSKEFRSNVRKVTGAIILFGVVYLLLFFAAIIIAGVMIALGCILLANIHMFLMLVLAIGFILSGIMLVFFLIKFLFAKNPPKAVRYEITESDQPDLFNFIRRLTIETGAPFPKHIYITPDVNASVFFDSSFWSMFFPVKKNLNIGLALVNCLNQAEFKAVLAHEFGHFSQRSMRFGSYVFSLNKVIYNVLYENKGYDTMLNAWARWHNVLRLTAIINVKIVLCIQYILKKMYVILNKAHLGLSRQMEFHADAMAAYYSGSNNMVAALRRIEMGDNCYSTLLSFLNLQLSKGFRSANVYPQHLVVMERFAVDHRLKTDESGLPLINKGIAALKNSNVIINNQWSSHPTFNDREYSLNQLNIIAEPVEKSAWLLFKNAAALQEIFTEQMYATVDNYQALAIMNLDDFKQSYKTEIEAGSYNKAYNGFYDARMLNSFDVDEAAIAETGNAASLDELLTDENCNLPNALTGIRNDMALLDVIINSNNKEISTFDFKGNKYPQQDGAKIKEILNSELEETQQQIAELDKKIFSFFYRRASNAGLKQQLIDQYKKVFNYQKLSERDYENYSMIMADINPIYSKMKVNDIYDTLSTVYFKERDVKSRIREVMADEEITSHLTEAQKTAINLYLKDKWVYYTEPHYDNQAIGIFNNGLNAYIAGVAERNFQAKKELFNFQLGLLANPPALDPFEG